MLNNDDFKMLVGGELVGSGETFDVLNPSDGSVLAKAPHAGEGVVDAAVAAARAAYPKWASKSLEARHEVMVAVKEAFDAHKDELTQLLVREQGKPLPAAKGEIEGCSALLLAKATTIEAPKEVAAETGERQVVSVRRPIGVVACITPWNFPLFCSINK